MGLPLHRPLFCKVLTAVLALVSAGLGVALWLDGTVAARDVAGSLISGVLLAYLVHLWLWREEDA